MNKIFLVLSLYFLILLQVGFWSFFPINQSWPNLILIAVLIISCQSKNRSIVWLSVLTGGLLLDIFYYQEAGLALLSLSILILISQTILNYFELNNFFSHFFYLALLIFAYEPIRFLLHSFVMKIGVSIPSIPGIDFFYLLNQTIYSLILIVFIWLILPHSLKEKYIS